LNPSTFTKITSWTTLFDNTSSFSVANSNFVAPVSGYYQCFGQLQINNATIIAGTQFQVAIYVNGTQTNNVNIFIVASSTASYYTCQFNNLVYAQQGQTIDIRALETDSNPINSNTLTNFVSIVQIA
jgi:hypothetical protein